LVSATIPLSVGAGLASKFKKDGRVSVAFFGDGATEEGHFHESLNLAALYQLPVIFVCENNFYASHMSLMERRAKDNIYRSSEAHGMAGRHLDGNDVLAVYDATVEAVVRARCESKPTLLECRTYRWRGHVGPSWDMDVGVKRKDELKDWMAKDPVARLVSGLEARGVSKEKLAEIETEVQEEVGDSLEFARSSPYPSEESLAQHVYWNATETQ
jgi:pyruvate dehydrogenase E1 component alpha subunit